MKTYLLPPDAHPYKANLHCHTTLSDGRRTPEEVKALYLSRGYSVVVYTDHDLLIPHDELTDERFLALHGFELEITEKGRPWPQSRTTHLCMIGLEPDTLVQPCWHRSFVFPGNGALHKDRVRFDPNEPDFERSYTPECVNEVIRRCREAGFFVTYNHPSWSLERYPDYIPYQGMHAVEMFNGTSLREGYDEYNARVYDDFLAADRRAGGAPGGGRLLYCTGSDDNHNCAPDDSADTDSFRAFTVILAPELSYRSVTRALQDGAFYASEGPLIHALWVEDGRIHIRCSPAQSIQLVCGTRHHQAVWREKGQRLTGASFVLKEGCGWLRLTVTDRCGRHACTNAYRPEEYRQ